eukprot:CCRYP_003558-RC/>CCRYP_003558-RC protein AED:0.20 eAED:0.20 QI:174/1/1/1/0.28/0.37/8/5083/922
MIGFKPLSLPTGASLPPPSQPSIVSDSSYSATTPPEKCHSTPWQVKWKRPRLHRVVLGIDAPGDDDECACDEFYEGNRDDWIPISSSSVVLTRDDARRAILELHKRDKLLVKKRRQKQEIDKFNDGIFPKYNNAQAPTTPTKIGNENERDILIEKTPRNSNVKKGPAITPSTLFSPSSWFKKSTQDLSSPSAPLMQSTDAKPPVSGHTTKSNAKPPRFQRNKNKSERSLLSPPTSTLFTTFPNVTTPPPNSSSRHLHSPQDEEGSSPPTIPDASTASSLLWEDNTLTSVSEEDAVAFRMYETKLRQSGGAGVGASSMLKNDGDDNEFSAVEGKQTLGSRDEDDEYGNFGGGRYYCDRHGNLRLSEWDGFDNVVLSVTVYAVGSCDSNTIENVDSTNQKRRPTSGEVVVMELLSTKNPPYVELSDARSGELKKVCSSSPLSHKNPRPPPPPTTSVKGNWMCKDECDASAASSASNTEQQQQIDEDDKEETSSNHPRILARRVLRWPSSLMSLNSKKWSRPIMHQGTLYSNCNGCPSFVSLGRGGVWNPRMVDEKQHSTYNRNGAHCTDQEERTADAIDAIRCLDFLFGESGTMKAPIRPNSHSLKDVSDTEDSTAKNDRSEKEMKTRQPLCLCFVTNDGCVHFFHAMHVFLSRNPINKAERNISNSFAALLLGEELLTKVLEDVMPLSHPHVSLKLSQATYSRETGPISNDISTWNTILSTPRGTNTTDVQSEAIAECEAESRKADWTRLIDFDASIDPLSLRYRTLPQSNITTGTCVTTNPENGFLAICGKGLRRIFSRNGRSSRYTLGGFITFISLRHFSEVKSIFVPFAIDRVEPVYWNGLHFVILLGEEGSLDQELRLDGPRPFAMAIRVDSKGLHNSMPDKSGRSSHPDRFQPVVINLSAISESLRPQSFPKKVTRQG